MVTRALLTLSSGKTEQGSFATVLETTCLKIHKTVAKLKHGGKTWCSFPLEQSVKNPDWAHIDSLCSELCPICSFPLYQFVEYVEVCVEEIAIKDNIR